MAAFGPTFQLFIDQVVHLAEHPLGDLRRVEVRPAANLTIEDRYQVRHSALLVLANDSRQIGEVPLLCRPTGSDECLGSPTVGPRCSSPYGSCPPGTDAPWNRGSQTLPADHCAAGTYGRSAFCWVLAPAP